MLRARLILGFAFTALAALAVATSAQQQVPQWQLAAGGSAKFDVASVKQNKSTERPYFNLAFAPRSGPVPTGGLFRSTNNQLLALVGFAYKLTGSQMRALPSKLPRWAATESFDIEAHASGNPTVDQMRLMAQSLLEDRFKLSAHYETRDVPVFALVRDQPGKLGPSLRAHSDALPCAATPLASDLGAPPPTATVAGGFPAVCNELVQLQAQPGPRRVRFGAREMTSATLVDYLNAIADVDRPILDMTGLIGNLDFTIEFVLQFGPSTEPQESGATFQEALKDQLGLKLVPQTGPVEVLVIDHIEEPTPN